MKASTMHLARTSASTMHLARTSEQQDDQVERCNRGSHRRSNSDPTEVMRALRDRNPKRDLSPLHSGEMLPELKKHATGSAALFGARSECGDASEGEVVKKDVPMWTVEEDLLILTLVEHHGKRWAMISARLPGRTDNGVRNRWNRMQRAQVVREIRGPEAGYRCRKCGQPKRGHICAALTLGDAPAGEELAERAEALTRLSADKMRTVSPVRKEEFTIEDLLSLSSEMPFFTATSSVVSPSASLSASLSPSMCPSSNESEDGGSTEDESNTVDFDAAELDGMELNVD